jgi:hypothetical protein
MCVVVGGELQEGGRGRAGCSGCVDEWSLSSTGSCVCMLALSLVWASPHSCPATPAGQEGRGCSEHVCLVGQGTSACCCLLCTGATLH